MIKKIWEYDKFRFICIGVFNTLFDLSILNTLVYVLHFPVWLANTISVSISISVSYFLNHYIVFRHDTKPNLRLYSKFFLITGICVIALQTIIIYLTKPEYLKFVNNIISTRSYSSQIALNLAKLTAVLIGLGWNYFFYSKIVFKEKVDIDARDSVSVV
jgi:putative flippase GtrA